MSVTVGVDECSPVVVHDQRAPLPPGGRRRRQASEPGPKGPAAGSQVLGRLRPNTKLLHHAGGATSNAREEASTSLPLGVGDLSNVLWKIKGVLAGKAPIEHGLCHTKSLGDMIALCTVFFL